MSLKLKTLVLSMIAAIVNVACSSEAPIKNDDAAAQAAKCYYDSLNNGGYEYFTDMYHRQERIPDSYREQLVANTKMYLDNIKKEHKGISEVRVLNCKNDSLHPTAEAYLLLCFGDGTKEAIVVPMVKDKDKWMMR